MPAFHSAFNKADPLQYKHIGKIPLLPIQAKHSKGPAPRLADAETKDIIEETIRFFRANVFFSSFKIEESPDRLLVYLTLFCHQCLMRIAKCRTRDDAAREMYQLGVENFTLPTDSSFILKGFFEAVTDKSEQDLLRQYLQQCRQELANRLLDVCCENDRPSKWWTCFAKRKFLNKALEGPGSR
eukprot:m.22779 g.22779  ORF g.22779 m.22779 type:complete len:184 (-) comp9369_c0_seq1:958-1509(-)